MSFFLLLISLAGYARLAQACVSGESGAAENYLIDEKNCLQHWYVCNWNSSDKLNDLDHIYLCIISIANLRKLSWSVLMSLRLMNNATQNCNTFVLLMRHPLYYPQQRLWLLNYLFSDYLLSNHLATSPLFATLITSKYFSPSKILQPP